MATLWRGRFLAGLMLVTLLGAGCNMMALPYFLLAGMENKTDAKCRLASDDKDKEVKVVIRTRSGVITRPEFSRIDRDLGRLFASTLDAALIKNKEKVKLVPFSRMERYKDDHPAWQEQDPQEIGKYFKADYVIDLEIDNMTLYEPGSMNTLFRGRAEISVKVFDMHKAAAEGSMYSEEYIGEYPKAQGPIPAGDSNVLRFRQGFLTVVARELSWRFTSHPVDDDYKCDL